MKLTYSLIAAAIACGFASAQTSYTVPVGYVTKQLKNNQYTLLGLTVHEATKSAGIITASSAHHVTIAGGLNALLGTPVAPGSGYNAYILELTDGTVQIINTWTDAGDLTTPDDISSKVVAGTTTYKLRKAATVSSIFGATNSVGLNTDTDGNWPTNGTDTILIPNANNAFDTVYYFNDGAGTQGWFDDQANPADNKPIPYPDGFYVRRTTVGSTLNLVVSGEVKTAKTSGVITYGWNYLCAVAPVGLTVGTSGMEAYMTHDTDGNWPTNGTDLLLVPNGSGAYITTYYFNDGAGTMGWFDDQANDATNLALDTGFLVSKKAAGSVAYTLNVPASYSTL
jgi:hypothetical protein